MKKPSESQRKTPQQDRSKAIVSSIYEAKVAELDGKSMEAATDTMVDLALDLFLKEKEKNREIFKKAPKLGRIPSLLRLRQKVVERLAQEMEKHHPGKAKDEYIRVSFIAANSVMGVIHTMLYDVDQSCSLEQLATELKMILKVYFHARTQNSMATGVVSPGL